MAGGKATGGGGGGGGATTGGGNTGGVKPKHVGKVPTAQPRSQTSRQLMDLKWTYPVHKLAAPEVAEFGTSVAPVREALSREQALAVLAGTDPRPLLVLRECSVCNKTDDALLSRTESNERTLVLARWFHCVKLPVDVVEPDHPFHALFPSNESEHLFVSSFDGSAKVPLESDTSRSELWSAMEKTLAVAYDMDATRSVRGVLAGLDRVDQIESKVAELELRKGELMETPHVDLAKVRKLEADLVALKKEAKDERAAVEKLFQVEVKAAAPGVAR